MTSRAPAPLACIFCLPVPGGAGRRSPHAVADHQVVRRSATTYACVPRGQVEPGFMIAAPLRCDTGRPGGCLSLLSSDQLAELEEHQAVIGSFYRTVLGARDATFYEQGRAGGGAACDTGERFSHHGHLCALPLHVDLHQPLGARFARHEVASIQELAEPPVAGRPYVYVETVDGDRHRRAAYVGRNGDDDRTLERLRLKDTLCELLGDPGRSNWRDHPGESDVTATITAFHRFSGVVA